MPTVTLLARAQRSGRFVGPAVPVAGRLLCVLNSAALTSAADIITMGLEYSYDGAATWKLHNVGTWPATARGRGGRLPSLQVKPAAAFPGGPVPTHWRIFLNIPRPLSIGLDVET